MFDSLKSKIRENRATLIAVAGATACVGVVAAVVISSIKEAKLQREYSDAFVNALNDGLASGEFSVIHDNATGILTVVETSSL